MICAHEYFELLRIIGDIGRGRFLRLGIAPKHESCNEKLFLSILTMLHAWQEIQITPKML